MNSYVTFMGTLLAAVLLTAGAVAILAVLFLASRAFYRVLRRGIAPSKADVTQALIKHSMDLQKELREARRQALSADTRLGVALDQAWNRINRDFLDTAVSLNIEQRGILKRCIFEDRPESASTSPLPIEVKLDGNAWCATRSDFVNLVESTAGFGESPAEAVLALMVEESFGTAMPEKKP